MRRPAPGRGRRGSGRRLGRGIPRLFSRRVSRRDRALGVRATAAQGRGVGRALLDAFVAAAEDAGYWTIQASVFPENTASLALHERAGFRVVGRRVAIAQSTVGPHAGQWRDTILIEHTVPDRAQSGAIAPQSFAERCLTRDASAPRDVGGSYTEPMAASAPGQHPLHHDPIVTATPNPALDVSTSVDRVVAEHKLRCGPTRLDPGGGGINVSRVVRNLGGRSIAVYAVGGPTGQAYRELLEREGIVGRAVRIAASTRQSFTVDETDTGEQFRFVLQGPEMREPEWRAFLSAIARRHAHPRLHRAQRKPAAGSARSTSTRASRTSPASGAPDASSTRRGPLCARRSMKACSSSSRACASWASWSAPTLDDEKDMQDAAHELVHAGACDVVALTLGAAGALLVTADGAMRLPTPVVEVQSTVGAGDSFLGALVLRLAQGRDLAAAFRSAVAAGSATAMLPATDLCRLDDVAALEAGLEVVDVPAAEH